MPDGSLVTFRLPGNLPGMGVSRDGKRYAGVSVVHVEVGGRYTSGTPLFLIEVEGMASMGEVVELLADFDCVVAAVHVSAGQWITAGQVLAELRRDQRKPVAE